MPSNWKMILTWVLRLLVAALFLMTGFFKFSGNPMALKEFADIGLGDWFRYVTGLVEVGGALLVLYPRTTPWGALWLLCVCVGIFIAQATRLHQDLIHPFIFAAVIGALFYLTKEPVMNRLNGRKA